MATKEISLLLTAKDQASQALKDVSGGLSGLEAAVGKLLPVLGGIGAAIGVQEIIDSAVAWDKYENALTAITGSAEEAQKELDYIWETADRLGVNVNVLADNWTKFLAASKGTVIEGEQTRLIFEAVANATSKLGLSSEETTGALNAVQQMMSKGKVTAEELRGQLGERVPGAFAIFAKAAGVSTAMLDEMLSKGEVTVDLLPKVAEELNKVYATASNGESATQAINRFNNSIEKFKVELGEAGVLDVFISVMKTLQELMGDDRVIESIRNLGKSFEGIISGSGPALITAVEGIIKVLQVLAIGVQFTVSSLEFLADRVSQVAAAFYEAANGNFKQALTILEDPTPFKNAEKNFLLLEKSTSSFWGSTNKASEGSKKLSDENKNLASSQEQVGDAMVAAYEASKKATEATKSQADASKKAAEDLDKQRQEAAKLALEMEKIASNERIRKIEMAIGLKTEQLKADVEVAKQIISGIDTSIKSTGDLLGSLFGNLKGASDRERWAIQDQVEIENRRRDEALQLQKDLTTAQIDALNARTEKLRSGDALIQMTLDGVEPELEMILWKIVERLQVRMNEEAASFLLGVATP